MESDYPLIPSAQIAIIALLCALYAGTGVRLFHDWWVLPDFSHGFVVFAVLLAFFWRRKAQLRQTVRQPDWRGLALLSTGVIVLLLGTLGAEIFLTRLSFLVVCAGLVWLLGGSALLAALRAPLILALTAIPLPAVIYNRITFPLQLFASSLASSLLPFLGVPVLRDGNILRLPGMQLEVAEACSGIRSLMSLICIALIFGYLTERSPRKRTVLVLSSIPIAVAANALRIVGTGLCVQYWDPTKAVGFFHEFSGWLMFLVTLVCLFGIRALLGTSTAKEEQKA